MIFQQIFLDILLGFGIGLSLGLMGGGGSILTVPALVYFVGQSPQAAVTASLVIVGINSSMGAWLHRRQGTLDWKVALIFGGSGMAAAYIAAGWSQAFSPTMLMLLFALLMLAVGAFMVLRPQPADTEARRHGLPVIILSGIAVGILTGFLGVGGGFLIVPALVMLVGLPMRQAVGTSLVIIAMNSLAGFLGHMNGAAVDFQMIFLFVGAGILGALAGARLCGIVPPEALRKGFAVFVIILAVFLLADNLLHSGWIG
ncbi:MAG: sulfite exporter TauE/SafE family protein [Caldilineaceae bacterium]|nr:sulfite exporter TauE/SafE family protein [Caldilineaceae bacterium]